MVIATVRTFFSIVFIIGLIGRIAPIWADDDPPLHFGTIEASVPAESVAAPSAFSTIILPQDRAYQFTTVPELLAETVGTTVRNLGGPGQFSTVSIRGSSAEQVAIFVDGVRINSGAAGAVDIATLPTGSIERIEVIRGGGTTQFGGDAIGGVINIITKQPTAGMTLETTATGGSFLTFKTNESLSAHKKDLGFVVGHTHLQSKGNYTFQQATTTLAGTPVAGGGTFRRDHNRFYSDDLLTKIDLHTDATTHVNLTNDFFWTDRQLPGTESEATLLAPANPLEATQRIYRDVAHIGVRFDDLWTPRLALDLGINNTFEHGHFADPSPAIGTAIDRATINDAINPYVHWGYVAPTAHGGHAMAARYDYRRDMYDDTAGNATTSVIGAKARDGHQLSVQDEWTLADDHVTLLPVARIADTNDFPAIVGGKLGAIVRPIMPIGIKANIESAHRYPTFSELYYPDEGYLRGNPNLNKESSLNWDAGVATRWAWGKFEAAYYQQRIRNSILFVPISATTIQPINTFAARAEGIEVSAEATPFAFCKVSGNYTWLRARFTSSGLQLPGRPAHTGNGRIEFFREFNPRWGGRFYTDAQWVGRLPVNVANSVFLAARTTLDIGITATYTKYESQTTNHKSPKYFATLEARDLTNVQVYDARGFPLPRRSFFFTVGAKWS